VSPRSVDDLLVEARTRIERVSAEQLGEIVSGGGLVVDIRPQLQREAEGGMPGALVIERNVLEWRFDLQRKWHIDEVTSYEQQIVIFCSEGYTSSLAAASLQNLGFSRVADLDGGYKAWVAWLGDVPPGQPGRLRSV
jgi:rhodanese-related sulfurtransferase